MNTSPSAVSSAIWLPEPATDVVGQESPKTKPVQTEVESRLWKIRQQTVNSKKIWAHALVYTLFAGSSAVSVAYAFRSLSAHFSEEGRDDAVTKFFE
jgi:hypothetical protein